MKRNRIQHKSIEKKRDNNIENNSDNDDNDIEKNENWNLPQNDAFSQSIVLIFCIEINIFIFL